MIENLLQRVPTDLKLFDCRPLAQAFDKNPAADFRPILHIYVQIRYLDDDKDIELSPISSNVNEIRLGAPHFWTALKSPPSAVLFDRR